MYARMFAQNPCDMVMSARYSASDPCRAAAGIGR